MPATGRSPRKPRATQAMRERYEQNNRVIDRVSKSLQAAQTDLTALRGSVGAGASDLRKDLTRLLRDARRDVGKMSRAVRRDLERVQQDLSSAARSTPARTRRGTRATGTSKPRTRGASRGTGGRAATRRGNAK